MTATSTAAPPTQDAGAVPRGSGDRAAWVLVALATVASLGYRLVIARWVDGPFIFQDEGGYLGVARALAGQDPDLYGPTYHPLWGLLLAPAAAVLDPPGQHTAAQVLNAVAAAAIIPVLHLLGRRVCQLPPRTAALAAVAGGLTAASLVQATMLLPEVLLALLVAASVLLVHRALASGRTAAAVVAGITVGATYGAHPRAIVLVAAVLVVVGVAWRSEAVDRRGLVVLAGVSLSTAAAAELLDAWATSRLYPSGTQPSLAGSPLGAVAEPVGSAVITLGQAWYLIVASAGLAALGALAAGRVAWTRRTDAVGLTGLLVVLGAVGSLALGTIGSYEVGLAEDVARADLPLYGRYLEQWLPVLIVWAAALPRFWRRAGVPVLAAGIAAAAVALHAIYPSDTWRQPVAWHNISTLRLPVDLVGDDHVVATGFAAAGLALLAALPRRAGDWRWVLPLAAVAAANVVAGHWLVRDWAQPSATRWAERQVIAPLVVASGEPAWVDLDEYHEIIWAYNAQIWHPDLEVRYFEGEPPSGARNIVARADDAPAAGATLAAVEPHGDYALWTRPRG